MSIRVTNLGGSAADWMLFQGNAAYGFNGDEYDDYDGYDTKKREYMEASPIYSSLQMTYTISGERTKDYGVTEITPTWFVGNGPGGIRNITETFDYTLTRTFTRVPIEGSVSYAGKFYPDSSIDTVNILTPPSGSGNAYFTLPSDGMGVDADEYEYNLMRFDRQCLKLIWNYSSSFAIVGTRVTTKPTGSDDTGEPIEVDIYQAVDTVPPFFGMSETAGEDLYSNGRAYNDRWV